MTRLVVRLVEADVARNGIAGRHPNLIAMACYLADDTLQAIAAYDPITGEPRNAGLPVDEEGQP